jgi:hypothetical protein
MHCNAIFIFLGLALPTCIVAQQNEHTYCDMEKAPNMNDCFNIKDNGVRDSEFYKDDEWWSGNCAVKVSGGVVSGSLPSMPGSWLKQVIQDILNNCDSGVKYHNGVRVDVVLCIIGQGGINTECSSPLMKVGGFPYKKRETNAIVAKRCHLTDVSSTPENPSRLLARYSEPYAGLICGGGPGTSDIASCKEALDELKGMDIIKLPYKTAGGTCDIQIYPTNRDMKETSDTTIPQQIEHDLDVCADSTKTYVGMVENYRGYGYHWFAGAFCGTFNTGRPGYCWPGGK